ncbi:carboxypeptidase M32 [Candidatus Woesearchaeota archaeon]|nr:carboxypeptidase M32 [Candidatus Woesearchaeota archaeon]
MVRIDCVEGPALEKELGGLLLLEAQYEPALRSSKSDVLEIIKTPSALYLKATDKELAGGILAAPLTPDEIKEYGFSDEPTPLLYIYSFTTLIHGQGIGKTLLQDLLQEAKKRGYLAVGGHYMEGTSVQLALKLGAQKLVIHKNWEGSGKKSYLCSFVLDEGLRKIQKTQREIMQLKGTWLVLDWDQNTIMPSNGTQTREYQGELLQQLIHDRFVRAAPIPTYDRYGHRFNTMILEQSKVYKRQRQLSTSVVRRVVSEVVKATSSWKYARKMNDYTLFQPSLKRMVEIKRRIGNLIDPINPYDALLQEYEEGMNTKKLDALFGPLATDLSAMLKKIKPTHPDHIKADRKSQERLVHDLLKRIGIGKDELSVSLAQHPFTTIIGPGDVRIATRYAQFDESFFNMAHEAGHALYGLGLPTSYGYTLLYGATSYGLDESQAMFWEHTICRSKAFWEAYISVFRRHIHGYTAEKVFRLVNQVRPSYIRVNADELTYCLHIILRYEIERGLINGTLQVKEAKDYWNKRFYELFGLKPRNDNEGILQDIHWATGDFGYFPSYAIGMIYAAQLSAAMRKQVQMGACMKRLDFTPFTVWLTEHVYRYGRTRSAEDIITTATGAPLDASAFTSYLKDKFGPLYGF